MLLDLRIRREIRLYPTQKFATDFLMGHFTTTKPQRDLGLVSFLQKANQVTHLHLIVALFRPWAKLHFLDLNLLLLALCRMRLLVLFEQELSEIHDPAHRRISGWRDFNEIELRGLGHLQGLEPRDYADLLTFRIDDAKSGCGDLFIAPNALSNRGSDASYLQTGPTAARNFCGKLLSDDVDGHRSEIFTATGAHGQRIRTCLAIACYQ